MDFRCDNNQESLTILSQRRDQLSESHAICNAGGITNRERHRATVCDVSKPDIVLIVVVEDPLIPQSVY